MVETRASSSQQNGFSSGAGLPQPDLEPPRFTVDLSLPPRARYTHITPHFLPYLTSSSTSLTTTFTSLINELTTSTILRKILRMLSHVVFTRLHSAEETAELLGIAEDTKVPMYILVAFNALLDILMGCTSCGVRVDDGSPQTRLVHFRTLDWGMHVLRPLTVELDFIRSGVTGDKVIATSVTYFGYVGILTGVREGLSVSLNFRPSHDSSTLWKEVAFRAHQVYVLLGWRKGVASLLRGLILDEDIDLREADEGSSKKEAAAAPDGKQKRRLWDLLCFNRQRASARPRQMADILDKLLTEPSTAAYFILCTPQMAYTIEKDHRTGTIFSSDKWLTTLNHDRRDEDNPAHLQVAAHGHTEEMTGMENIIMYSIERRERLDEMWSKLSRRKGRKRDPPLGITLRQVVDLVMDEYISNDETHFSVIMDPEAGTVIWRSLSRYRSRTRCLTTEIDVGTL